MSMGVLLVKNWIIIVIFFILYSSCCLLFQPHNHQPTQTWIFHEFKGKSPDNRKKRIVSQKIWMTIIFFEIDSFSSFLIWFKQKLLSSCLSDLQWYDHHYPDHNPDQLITPIILITIIIILITLLVNHIQIINCVTLIIIVIKSWDINHQRSAVRRGRMDIISSDTTMNREEILRENREYNFTNRSVIISTRDTMPDVPNMQVIIIMTSCSNKIILINNNGHLSL